MVQRTFLFFATRLVHAVGRVRAVFVTPLPEAYVPSTLRVHSLAKELGVPSKVLLEKCRAEGIELKNHMAAISAGLAESIREWFSVEDDKTSIESAERVDVEKVRVRRRKRAEAEAESPSASATDTATVEAEPPAAPPAPAAETAAPAEPPAEKPAARPTPATWPEVAAPTAPEVPAAPAEPPPATPDVVEPATPTEAPAEPAPETLRPAAQAETPTEAPAEKETAAPEKESEKHVGPAGPQVVPTPAELKGPRVVRVEAPETTHYPRPRPAVPREPGAPAEDTAGRGPRRRGKGRRGAEEDANRARSRSPRRQGGPSEVDQRMREWREQDLLERKERLAGVTGHGLRDRRAAERRRQQVSTGQPVSKERKEPISIVTPVTIKDFCAAVGVPFVVISKKLMEHTGKLWTINQSLDTETAELLALDLDVPLAIAKAKTAYERLQDEVKERERPNLAPRPPVVAMLGHVDHGKTSLLDAIRHANVAAGEAGGITQHIGAYRIQQGDWDVTFVDTPGHEAFTAMRARGANLTDVVVLVIAADDGVMPQTVEAINHAKAAGVAIVVALNKIDIPGVDINRVYGQLAEHELTPSEWGGDTDVIQTSATSGQGMDDLVGHLSTLSELLELQADPTVPAVATVIEAEMREGQGVLAQVLVREGTLKPGQTIVCGPGAGRIRALVDSTGKQIREAGPGTPVGVVGLTDLPSSGDNLYEVDSLGDAKSIAEEVQNGRRAAELEATARKPRTLEELLTGGSDTELPELKVIIRADAQGSVEVLRKSLDSFPSEKAKLNILQSSVGAITEADVNLAKASDALVIGFHVVAEDRARQLADQLGVEVRLYRVIYEMLDDLHKALAGLLEPEKHEEIRGSVEVRQIFNVSRVGTIAGCYVTDGIVNRNHRVRLVRDGRVITENKPIDSLKRFKDDAREVRAGLECGIKLQGFDDIKPGDVFQTYELVEVAAQL
jgi:translation initiation factor IF-2